MLRILGLLIPFLFLGCSTKIEIAKLPLPQDASYFLQKEYSLEMPKDVADKLKEKYLEVWFSPWKKPLPNPNVAEVFWIAPSLLKNLGFGPNLKQYTLEEMRALYDSMEMESYPSVAIKAIVLRDTAVRAVPTSLPKFKTRDNYPFDRWQNSLIFEGTPVLITHFNTTRDWAHIQSSFVYGWMRVQDLAKITQDQEEFFYQIKNYVLANKDQIPIYDADGAFLSMGRIGKIFGVKQENEKSFEILLVEKKSGGFAALKSARVQKTDFSLFPKRFDALNIANVVDTMMGQFYGWGGELQSRDCSAFLRDSFASFGLYLPRNSAAQARYGNQLIDLSKMNAKEKEEFIIKNATPFATLLWSRGHIMLYIGTYENKAVVIHSAWSVLTKQMFAKTENILGGVVITTLRPENEKNGWFIKSKTLLDRVLGMSDLYQYILNLP